MPDDISAAASYHHEKRSSYKLRFKNSKRRNRREHESSSDEERRHKARRERLSADDEAFYNGNDASMEEATQIPSTREDSDREFVERLYDAMADDEGGDYWANYYSQPIHTYPRPKDDMTEEEYAAYVRRHMWEKSHNMDQRKRSRRTSPPSSRADVPKAYKQPTQRPAADNGRLQKRWQEYLYAWEADDDALWTLATVPWPTQDGHTINPPSLREFLAFAGDLKSIAKQELRRHWHPDKFSQLKGHKVLPVDKTEVLARVTLVSQILNEILSSN